MNPKINLKDLAKSWVNTDAAGIRGDVRRLGGVKAAAEYSANMAAGQPHWEALCSRAGRAALAVAIREAL